MIAAAAWGWVAAALATVAALAAWRRLTRTMQLIARGCHELRGPLAAARLGLELGSRTGELSDARLRAIDQELERATLVLEDLGAAPRERGPDCWEQVDVRQLLLDCVEARRASAALRQARLELQWSGPPARVPGQRLRLAQAIGNLIANAIEHGGRGVAVHGRVHGDSVRIEVIDRGLGLPAPVTDLVRCAGGARGRHGHGLAIAASVAEAHGGRLASAPTDHGARVVLELPLR